MPGVTAAQTPDQIRAAQAAFHLGTDQAAQAALQQQQVPMQQQVSQPQFTAEQLEEARRQEKDKLYPQLTQVQKELDDLRAEREAERQAREQAEAEAQAAARAAEEKEMDVRQLLERKEQEFNERFNQLEQARQQAEALLQQEHRFQALMQYRQAQLAAAADDIIPQLLDTVQGSSEAEIDASILDAKNRSLSILQSVQQAQQQAYQGMRGTALTAPAAGPMENMPVTQQLSAQDIASMSMAEYAKHRGQLHQAASAQFRGGGR